MFNWSLITPTAKFTNDTVVRWQHFLNTGFDHILDDVLETDSDDMDNVQYPLHSHCSLPSHAGMSTRCREMDRRGCFLGGPIRDGATYLSIYLSCQVTSPLARSALGFLSPVERRFHWYYKNSI